MSEDTSSLEVIHWWLSTYDDETEDDKELETGLCDL